MKKDALLFTLPFLLLVQFGILIITGQVEHHPMPSAHGLMGIAFMVVIFIHLLLHWRWITAAVRRYDRMPASVRTNILLDIVLLGGYLACGSTGLLASESSFYPFGQMHWVLAFVVIAVQVIHLARHWKWILAIARRPFPKFRPNLPSTR
jgi:hypothetical protein